MPPPDPSNPVTPPRSQRHAHDTPERTPAEGTVVSVSVAPAVPPILTASATPGSLFAALGRRWLLALSLGLLGAGLAGAALWQLVPAPFTAQLQLELKKPPTYMPGTEGLTNDDYLRTQAALIRSPQVLNAVLANGQVKELASVPQDPAEAQEWLVKNFTIKLLAGDSFLPLKFSCADGRDAATILKVIVEEYRNELRRIRKAEHQRLESSLRLADKDLKALAVPPYDPKALEQARVSRRTVESALQRARADLEARKENMTAPSDKEIADAVEEYLKSDMDYRELKKKLDPVLQEMKLIIQVSKDRENDLQLVPLRRIQAGLEKEMGAIRKKVEVRLKDRLTREARARQEEKLEPYKDKVVALEQERNAWAAEVTRLELLETPDFRTKLAKANALEAARSALQQKIADMTLDGDDLRWVPPTPDPAVPTSPDRKTQLGAVALGSLGVFGVLLFTVALVEFRGRRVTSADAVSQGLGIPTVGTVPLLPARARLAALGGQESGWHGRLTESVDAIRTFLLRALGDGPHVVLVTSAVQGEGKTSLASQLAASLARAWRKTLLIDGDLRKPAAHQLFQLPVEPGLSEVLRGELELGDVIRPTTVGRLWLMPAGQWDAHALQALAQEGVGGLFEQLREEYEFVIVDSCPVLPVSDTLMLGQHVDTVLFSVLRSTSRLPSLYAAWQRLAALDIPVLGAVVAGGGNAVGGLDIQYPKAPAK
jgi:capsular exopolysaccharide synthesis family protein